MSECEKQKIRFLYVCGYGFVFTFFPLSEQMLGTGMSGWKSQVRWEISQVKGKLSLTTISQMIHSNEPQPWLLIKATILKNKK